MRKRREDEVNIKGGLQTSEKTVGIEFRMQALQWSIEESVRTCQVMRIFEKAGLRWQRELLTDEARACRRRPKLQLRYEIAS